VNKKKWLIVVSIVLALMIGITWALYSASRTVNNHGKIKGVNISLWWDANCTIPMTEIDWGVVEARAIDVYYVKYFWIKSESTVKILVQETVEITNVFPENMTFGFGIRPMSGVWTLEPGEVAKYQIGIHHINSPPGTTDFSFDATIVAVEYVG